MPSKDTFHEKNPELNAWLNPGAPKRRSAGRQMSSQILRLAERMGVDPDELAAKFPADTVRRTKYPVLEHVDADGRRFFKHDIGVENDARLASVRR